MITWKENGNIAHLSDLRLAFHWPNGRNCNYLHITKSILRSWWRHMGDFCYFEDER